MSQGLLIDTHVLLWSLFEPRRLGSSAQRAMNDGVDVVTSLASLWEIAIKYNKEQLPYSPATVALGVGGAGFTELRVEHRHINKLQHVSLPHGDPFDAMLGAQAMSDDLTLMTADRVMLNSGIPTVDARE